MLYLSTKLIEKCSSIIFIQIINIVHKSIHKKLNLLIKSEKQKQEKAFC